MSKSKKKLDEEYSEIIASGADGKQGVKAAKELFAKQDKQLLNEESFKREILGKKKKNKKGYVRFLGELLLDGLNVIEWPMGWTYKVAPTDIGVVMEIRSKDKKLYRTAFKAVGEEKYDSNAINNFVERAARLVESKGSSIIMP